MLLVYKAYTTKNICKLVIVKYKTIIFILERCLLVKWLIEVESIYFA
jgi:hypothetical protein